MQREREITKPEQEVGAPYYGYYSAQQEKIAGSCVYLDKNGNEVVVTEVSKQEKEQTNWPDTRYVGRLVKMIRRGHLSINVLLDGLS